jgi:hypothetical protein
MASLSHLQTVQRCANHLRLWLAAMDVNYCSVSREGFARAHPALFGCAYDVTLRGYERWRLRYGLFDTLESFARYLVRRHERWLVASSPTASLAPCLICGDHPCWKVAAAPRK